MSDNEFEDVLSKMRAALERDERSLPLSDQEVKVLRRMIVAFELLLSWGKLGKLMLWGLSAAAGAVLAFNAIRDAWK